MAPALLCTQSELQPGRQHLSRLCVSHPETPMFIIPTYPESSVTGRRPLSTVGLNGIASTSPIPNILTCVRGITTNGRR